MNLAIVGSRHFTNNVQFEKYVDMWITENGNPQMIVTGCAKGTDHLAREYAKKYNIDLKVYKADWKMYGKAAGPLRNAEIINNSTHVLAFPSNTGKGTQDTLKKAIKAKLSQTVYFIEEL
jgi:hypothetical protein